MEEEDGKNQIHDLGRPEIYNGNALSAGWKSTGYKIAMSECTIYRITIQRILNYDSHG